MNSNRQDKAVIGVIGAGTMGRGIVQLFAQAGHTVCLFDAADGAVDEGLSVVRAMVEKLVAKERISVEVGQATKPRLRPCNTIDDLVDCDVVIEAIVEKLEIKRDVFQQLESIVRPQAILASNTSSLLIADIACACKHPERVAGLHFFNPVPLMKVAEVVSSVRTAPTVIDQLTSMVEGAGHRAVVAQDQPGFLVNHAGRGLYTEGLRLLEENVTTPGEVDRTLRQAAGFRMGPFELLDLTGLDVSSKVMESIYQQFQYEPFFRPSSLVPTRVAAGLFGRKTSEGWYQYQDGKKVDPTTRKATSVADDYSVWVDPHAPQATELRTLITELGAKVLDVAEPTSLLLIQPWGVDASHACAQQGLDASRCVAIDPLTAVDKHRTLMTTLVTKTEYREFAYAVFGQDKVPLTLIADSPGFICQRVLAMVVNIASNIAQRNIATVRDIEDSVKLGLGYPNGPLSWGDQIGANNVLAILNGMYEVTLDPRYRPALWLRRRAQLGVSLLTEEQKT